MLVIVTGKIQEYDGWRGENSLHFPRKKPFANEAGDRSNGCTYTRLHIFDFSIFMQHSSHMSCPGDQIHHSIDAAVYYLIDRVLAPGQSYLQENSFSPSFNASRRLHDDRPFIGNGGNLGWRFAPS